MHPGLSLSTSVSLNVIKRVLRSNPGICFSCRNLPSKDPEEAERHRQEYESMVEMAKKKGLQFPLNRASNHLNFFVMEVYLRKQCAIVVYQGMKNVLFILFLKIHAGCISAAQICASFHYGMQGLC